MINNGYIRCQTGRWESAGFSDLLLDVCRHFLKVSILSRNGSLSRLSSPTVIAACIDFTKRIARICKMSLYSQFI